MSDGRSIWQRLDELDKKLSEPIFASRLPFYLLEFLLSIPGNWFGSCCFASATLPSLVAIFFDGGISEWHPWYGLVGCMFLVNLTLWVLLLSPKKSTLSHRARVVFYGPLTSAVAPPIGLMVLAISPLSTMARNMGYFQICAWSVGIIPTACLKPFVARQRPASYILDADASDNDERIKGLQRAAEAKHINTLPKLFTRDANASFPSGDTAGAMATMYSLIFLHPSHDPSVKLVGILLVLLSCFGRMYWMAHHMLDVLMGVLITLVPCVLLERIFWNEETGSHMQWWVPLVGHFILLVTVILTRWIFDWKVFGAGTISVNDGDEVGGTKGKKKE